jgi:hypothetical protein
MSLIRERMVLRRYKNGIAGWLAMWCIPKLAEWPMRRSLRSMADWVLRNKKFTVLMALSIFLGSKGQRKSEIHHGSNPGLAVKATGT